MRTVWGDQFPTSGALSGPEAFNHAKLLSVESFNHEQVF
jgi:hypothetical protein